MKAESSMGGRYFYGGLLVVYYFFRNFVASRNAYSLNSATLLIASGHCGQNRPEFEKY